MKHLLNKQLTWDSVFDLRYWFCSIIFVILLVLNINFSSIHNWNKIIPNAHPAPQFGTERIIRGDEWVVNTPWQLSQSYNHYQTKNEFIRHDGFNTILAQFLPAYNLENLGKPANWGFLLLDQSHGLSWYWLTKLLLLFLSSCEILYLFTKNKISALLGGFIIAYSPGIQWWFSNYIPELLTSMQYIIVCYYYLLTSKQKISKLLLAIPLLIFSIGFIFTIYPAWQVPLLYLILLLIIYYTVVNHIKLIDIYIIGAILAICSVLIIHFLYLSYNDISIMRNTVYPGNRMSVSGEVSYPTLLNYFFNMTTPFVQPTFSNGSELSSFWSLFPIFPLLCLIIPNKQRKGIFNLLLMINLIFLIWMLIPGISNTSITKYSLFSYIPGSRMTIIWGLLTTYLIILFVNQLTKYKINSFKYQISFFLIWLCMALIVIFACSIYSAYPTIAIAILLLLLIVGVLTFYQPYILLVALAVLTFISGTTINPLVIGTNDIYGSNLSQVVRKINQANPKQIWLATNSWKTPQFLVANGVKTFDGVQIYPDLYSFNKLDPAQKYQSIYNRYANIVAVIVPESQATLFMQAGNDGFALGINCNDLHKINIHYILDAIPPSQAYNYCNFNLIVAVDGFYIYQVK